MIIKYRAINPGEEEITEIAELVGISYIREYNYADFSFAGDYINVLFKMKEDEYENLLNSICEALETGKNSYTIKQIGIFKNKSRFNSTKEMYDYIENTFNEIKFKD